MAKFVYIYTGGQSNDTPESQEAAMAAWTSWLGGLASALTDFGNPFGASATVTADGSTDGAPSAAGGYSIIEADSLEDAVAKAKGCPALDGGGAVEVHEALAM
jgi:YCII-related domain